MGKRFIDTGLGRKRWFRRLTPVMKCAWRFLCEECDVAGAWSIDEETFEFHIGGSVDMDALIQAVNSDGEIRLQRLGKDKLWLPGFIPFQYGTLSPACKPHLKVIQRLKDLELWEGYAKGIHTLEEEEEEEDKEEEEEEEGEEEASAPTLAQNAVAVCKRTWLDSLAALGSPRTNLTPAEDLEIGRAIQTHGAEAVDLALYGARHEPAIKDFDPRNHVDITRILIKDKQGKSRIQKFVEYGARGRARKKAEEDAKRAAEAEREIDDTPTDPAKVRAELAKYGFGKMKGMP